jgi:RNA polymerase sigma-70 factor (ECF subfamily)
MPPADDDFESFYLATRRRLVGLVFALTGDLHEAEDVVQDAYAQAAVRWQRISRYDAPEAWVRRVACNLAANSRRRLRRQTAALLRMGRPAEVPPLDVGELDLLAALATLSAKQRQAVVLHHLAGMSVGEVATQMGAPEGTVKSLLARGRAALARELETTEEVGSDA